MFLCYITWLDPNGLKGRLQPPAALMNTLWISPVVAAHSLRFDNKRSNVKIIWRRSLHEWVETNDLTRISDYSNSASSSKFNHFALLALLMALVLHRVTQWIQILSSYSKIIGRNTLEWCDMWGMWGECEECWECWVRDTLHPLSLLPVTSCPGEYYSVQI